MSDLISSAVTASGGVLVALIGKWTGRFDFSLKRVGSVADRRLIFDLFSDDHILEAPYLLTCATKLWKSNEISDAEKREGLQELVEAVRGLKTQLKYLPEATELIQPGPKYGGASVWAVCGAKPEIFADPFYEANVDSFRKGNHVERVFFIPSEIIEADAIKKAMDSHFKARRDDDANARMLVRTFSKVGKRARGDWGLPPGFGMTVVGERRNGEVDPSLMTAVLIHWGGLTDPDSHHGVILKSRPWTTYFWNVYKQIRKVAPVAKDSPDADTFLKSDEGAHYHVLGMEKVK